MIVGVGLTYGLRVNGDGHVVEVRAVLGASG